jgi:hypothetical protein
MDISIFNAKEQTKNGPFRRFEAPAHEDSDMDRNW